MTTTGPLRGVRVLELAGLAPAPFACTLLSDLGAKVLRIDRTDTPAPDGMAQDPLARGRRSAAIDLKHPGEAQAVLRLVERADVFVEGFRPGVCERLGIGPDACLELNPRLVYARLTGYGQSGPLADRAGHDINYLALSGALEPLGPSDGPPLPPLNYVADFGGGGPLLAVGVLAALWERLRSGRGQVVDAAMTEGAALNTAILHGLRDQGLWQERRGGNLFDGSAPFYTTYACADGRFVAVGAIEPQFWTQTLTGLGLAAEDLPAQHGRAAWPTVKARMASVLATRTRDEWASVFDGTDACVTPVLSPFEAHLHPHNFARGTFTEVAGQLQPSPAPCLSRTPATIASPSPRPGEHTDTALADWGLTTDEINDLRKEGTLR
ncbi:CaiB/BaiF CoA transferase family protein [Streptomyces sp. NPDC057474]|uniref:CaiB/BaiF CoA transferase family protein n=1 Tax=Streptomyces sp. NPDC057474 TaxID=3346144 RepID=UPI0036BD186A